MMKKLYVFSATLFLGLFSLISFGALSEFNVYFLNGISNSPKEAKESRDKLRSLVLSDVPDSNVLNLYNNNDAALGEMIETVRRQASADNLRQVYKSFWKCVNNPSPETCDPANPPTASLRRIISQTLARYDQAAYVQNPQLQSMVSVLRDNYYNKRKKSLLVSHSQGNFYANQIVNYLQSFDPAVAACVEVVGVATPATYVAKSGPYETRADDTFINLARVDFTWGGSILPPTWNPPEGIYPDSSGHKFVASYLGPTALRQRIRNNIVLQTTSAADSRCVLPQVCKTVKTSGYTGHYVFSHFIGSDVRTVNVQSYLSGYGDDHLRVRIFAGNPRTTIYDRYASYGDYIPNFSFVFDPARLGATGVDIEVDGIACPSGWDGRCDPHWNFCIDCGDGACLNDPWDPRF